MFDYLNLDVVPNSCNIQLAVCIVPCRRRQSVVEGQSWIYVAALVAPRRRRLRRLRRRRRRRLRRRRRCRRR